MDHDPSHPPPEQSSIKKILQFLRFDRAPDSAEDLEQEIQDLLDEGEEHGLISADAGDMITSILELEDTLAKEIMTPRSEMVAVPSEATLQHIITVINEHGFSRIPVYKKTPDHIQGIIHVKDLLPHLAVKSPPSAGEICTPAYVVPETEKIADLLREFQRRKNHLAIIADEFGITRGLVTLEDILEEIVGEIVDEHDKNESEWKIVDEQTLISDGKVSIEVVEDFFRLEMPEGPYESVGGLIIHQLGKLPPVGATLVIEGLLFTVLLATKRRILSVQITRTGATTGTTS